jgi:nucleoid DNA-binding protein
MSKKLTTQDEFLSEYSKFSGYTKTSIKTFVDSFGIFIEYCIENNIEWKYPSFVELYFSNIPERETTKVGTNERIVLPPVRKAKLRLSNKLRKKQKEQNRVIEPILREIWRE